ncbi:MAG: proline/glycine betaine ABC transporter permease [Opitutales bacterium]|nr:proline/glycine betaine ABC transporter permease [Opitutales bacterium]
MIRCELPIGPWFEAFIQFLKDTFDGAFDAIRDALGFLIHQLEAGFTLLPWWLMIVLIAMLVLWRSGKGLALFGVLGLLMIEFTGLWHDTMLTVALVLVSTAMALILAIPLGILAARNQAVEHVVRPLLDFMQTMPAFVYLIPAVTFFSLGIVPGAIATIVFAMPPSVRLTQLGIKQVPGEVVEAAQSFGATPRQLLFKVQLPIAMPTMLAGVNQTIMLSLSMVVIAAMIGAPGLGRVVYGSIQSMAIGRAFEGGLAIVVIAILLDRLTHSFAQKR